MLNDISVFTSQPKQRFYDDLFLSFNLDCLPLHNARTGRKGASNHAFICAFIAMKCEGFAQVSDLHDYLTNNLIIAHYCGFNIFKPLPSYASFTRFLRDFDNQLLQSVMKSAVLHAVELGLIDSSFVALDATPVKANVCNNNPKSFSPNKFTKGKQPRADKDCKLGVQTASNQHDEKKFEYYWGYKNHVLVDCITGLPIFDLTTGANVVDSTVALDILSQTNGFLPISECSFLADKGYDVKAIYNTVKDIYHGDCCIPLNPRGTKDCKKLPIGNPICEAGLAMVKDGKCYDQNRTRQKYCCPFKTSKTCVCPCDHKKFNNGKKHRGCVRYITIPDDYRLSIDRNCKSFKQTYSLRTECERYNSRFKATGQERLWVRNAKFAENLNSITHISLLAVATAAVLTRNSAALRCFKTVKRMA